MTHPNTPNVKATAAPLTAEELSALRKAIIQHPGYNEQGMAANIVVSCLLAHISALEAKVRELEESWRIADGALKVAHAELNLRAGQAAGVEGDPSTGPLNGSFELGDMADASQMIERISRGENCLIDLTMIYAGFRRSQGSSQTDTAHHAADHKAGSTSDGTGVGFGSLPSAGDNDYHDSLHDDMLATKAASAAGPVKVGDELMQLARDTLRHDIERESKLLSRADRIYAAGLCEIAAAPLARALLASGLVGKRLDLEKVAKWLGDWYCDDRTEWEGATAIIAAFDKNELWEGE